MDFAYSVKVEQLQKELDAFMEDHVYPAEPLFKEQAAGQNRWDSPPVLEELKAEARRRGLWNLFLPDDEQGGGLTNVEYAPLAEISGRSPAIAPEALNCSTPDTGVMELLHRFGTTEQQQRWLVPLLAGEIRASISMTEPDVASSDATNIRTLIRRDGDDYVIQGRKAWASGAMSPRCKVAVVMGVTDADADADAGARGGRRHSHVLVPLDAPGVRIERSSSVFGYDDGAQGGHATIHFDDVRVPVTNLLGEEGEGLALAQAWLGPGRVHVCMRLIGTAERAFDLMCDRVHQRVAFGRPLADQGVVQEWIADARIRIEQARLLVLKTAWLMDTVGSTGARAEIAAIKVAVPEMATWVVDRAIQAHGGAGVSDDFPLAGLYASARTMQLADGPDEVHRRSLARSELGRYAPASTPR